MYYIYVYDDACHFMNQPFLLRVGGDAISLFFGTSGRFQPARSNNDAEEGEAWRTLGINRWGADFPVVKHWRVVYHQWWNMSIWSFSFCWLCGVYCIGKQLWTDSWNRQFLKLWLKMFCWVAPGSAFPDVGHLLVLCLQSGNIFGLCLLLLSLWVSWGTGSLEVSNPRELGGWTKTLPVFEKTTGRVNNFTEELQYFCFFCYSVLIFFGKIHQASSWSEDIFESNMFLDVPGWIALWGV